MELLKDLLTRIDKLEKEVVRLNKLIKQRGKSEGSKRSTDSTRKKKSSSGLNSEEEREAVRRKYQAKYGRGSA